MVIFKKCFKAIHVVRMIIARREPIPFITYNKVDLTRDLFQMPLHKVQKKIYQVNFYLKILVYRMKHEFLRFFFSKAVAL